MTASKNDLAPVIVKIPKNDVLEELKKKAIKEIKQELKIETEEIFDPIQKKRDEKKWKTSLGYYALNPRKFDFKARNF
jgi:hypothetical protein